MSLYASREGALYSSYDNYAGAQGFYQPEAPHGGMPAPPAGLSVQPDDPYADFYPAQSPQRMIFQEFQQMQPQYKPSVFMMPQMQSVQTSVMVPKSYGEPMLPQIAPVSYNQNLRGVGIKFGERIDPQTGGMIVFVKRLVRGGPADQSQKVAPGDVLLLINSEDVYGRGLEDLRDKIPGPAGTGVSLGFKNVYGQFYEVNLARTAYGGPEPQQQMEYAMPMPVSYMPQQMPMPPPRPVQYVMQQPQPQPQPQMVQYIQAPPRQATVQIVQRQPQMAPQMQYMVQQPQYAMQEMQPQYAPESPGVEYINVPRQQQFQSVQPQQLFQDQFQTPQQPQYQQPGQYQQPEYQQQQYPPQQYDQQQQYQQPPAQQQYQQQPQQYLQQPQQQYQQQPQQQYQQPQQQYQQQPQQYDQQQQYQQPQQQYQQQPQQYQQPPPPPQQQQQQQQYQQQQQQQQQQPQQGQYGQRQIVGTQV